MKLELILNRRWTIKSMLEDDQDFELDRHRATGNGKGKTRDSLWNEWQGRNGREANAV